MHNVLEPAVYGCLVSFGPNMFILDEAIDLHRKKLANIIIKKADFYEYLYFLDSDKLFFLGRSSFIKTYFFFTIFGIR